jgi:hypothetical protein
MILLICSDHVLVQPSVIFIFSCLTQYAGVINAHHFSSSDQYLSHLATIGSSHVHSALYVSIASLHHACTMWFLLVSLL